MSEDPTPLTQRLVQAAANADPVASTTRPEFVEHRASAVVVAVLRELATDGEQKMRMFHAMRLRDLADSIEKGAE